MPVWQSIYAELKDKNFEIISAAQDSGGEAAAGMIFDAAGVTYTSIIDVRHTISSLYNLVNVPSAVWIDEEGTIVRIDEGTFAKEYKFGSMEVGAEGFSAALRDWVEKGRESVYSMSRREVASKIKPRTDQESLGEPAFKLGIYFQLNGDEDRANHYWEQAQRLNPESWNYHRQDWSFSPEEAGQNWRLKFQALGDQPYYAPLDFVSPEPEH